MGEVLEAKFVTRRSGGDQYDAERASLVTLDETCDL